MMVFFISRVKIKASSPSLWGNLICPKEKEKGEEAAADFSDSCSKYCQHVNVRGGGTIRNTRKLGAPTRFVERLGLRDDFEAKMFSKCVAVLCSMKKFYPKHNLRRTCCVIYIRNNSQVHKIKDVYANVEMLSQAAVSLTRYIFSSICTPTWSWQLLRQYL